MRSLTLLALLWTLLTAPAVPAGAAELIVEGVRVSQERRRLVVRARGAAPGCPENLPLVARLSWQGEEAAPIAAKVKEGRFEAVWSLSALLLPGEYTAVISPDPAASLPPEGRPAPVRAAFVYGEKKQTRAALDRSRAWLGRAEASLRGVALNLENRAAWRRARARSLGAGPAARAQATSFRAFLEARLYPSLRVAAMDLKVYRRRLLFPPDPEAADLIARLPALMRARAREHIKALESAAGVEEEPLEPYRDLARRIARLLRRDEKTSLAAWSLGPQAVPEQGAVNEGVYQSANGGFRLKVPDGWSLQLSTRQPDLRLSLRPKLAKDAGEAARKQAAGRGVVVTLRPAGARLEADQSTGIEGWESWSAYRRRALEMSADGGAVRHLFDAELAGQDTCILERRLRRPDGAWVVLIARAPADSYEEVAALYESIAASLEVQP